MRIAVVSDIHGNRAALEAVIADLRLTSPDLVFHGGDLADSGSSPAEIVDRIRALGWPGVLGNTDELLIRPGTIEHVPASLSAQVADTAAFARAALGEERLAWLSRLPMVQRHGGIALVHASPASVWRAPSPAAADAELEEIYAPLGEPVVVYGHLHRPFVRRLAAMTVVNAGSVSLSYDGDPRAAYLLLDGHEPTIRRVEYNVGDEIAALEARRVPHAAWIASMLASASFQMP